MWVKRSWGMPVFDQEIRDPISLDQIVFHITDSLRIICTAAFQNTTAAQVPSIPYTQLQLLVHYQKFILQISRSRHDLIQSPTRLYHRLPVVTYFLLFSNCSRPVYAIYLSLPSSLQSSLKLSQFKYLPSSNLDSKNDDHNRRETITVSVNKIKLYG